MYEINIKNNLEFINNEIKTACEKCGRNYQEITLVGVSKTKSAELINQAIDCGLRNIGENYVQEIIGKYNSLKPADLHFIGHLQSNKAKQIVPIATLIHSADSLSLLKEINKQAKIIGKIQDVLLEINISGENTKFGLEGNSLSECLDFANNLGSIRIKGLMGMAPFTENKEKCRPYFQNLKKLFDSLPDENRIFLSMGMSGDFREAIYEGSNMIRIGTAIFGERNYNN